MATAKAGSRRSSPGPAVGRSDRACTHSVSGVIRNPCTLFEQVLYRGSTPGRVAGFAEQHHWRPAAVRSPAGHRPRPGWEGQYPGPQLGGEGQRLLQLRERCPLLSMCTHPARAVPALGEAVAVTHQGSRAHPRCRPSVARSARWSCRPPATVTVIPPRGWRQSASPASCRAVRLLRGEEDCRRPWPCGGT